MILRCTRMALLWATVVLVMLSLALQPATAQTSDRHHFDIPAGDLGKALTLLGQQAEREIVFPAEIARGKRSLAVQGDLTAKEALDKLLAGSGLTYRLNSTGPVIVEASPGPLGERGSGKTEGPPATTVTKAVPTTLEEVVVTGSRIPTVAGNQVQPVRSYTREVIESSGQSTVGDFLNTLPDVSNFTNGSVQIGYAGVQTVQLHGLPIGTTLALLDGRRLETNILGFFDLSNIPLSAVERVEVAPVVASALYGADAIGGAVNTILRKNFNGFEVNASVNYAPD